MDTITRTPKTYCRKLWPMKTWCLVIILPFLISSHLANAQSFNSGSDGSDGALDFSTSPPNTTIVFDPTTFNPPLDPDGDRVFHFTTINIPADVTVRLQSDVLGMLPINWLATGAVQIDGTVDITGAKGHLGYVSGTFSPALAGPGGFGGGIGARNGIPCTKGFGPGGGNACQGRNGFGGSHLPSNPFLLPLVGGSGGGGGTNQGTSLPGGGGGAGGGAILVASSVSIGLNGSIDARGGAGGDQSVSSAGNANMFRVGGGGSGGAVRLVAPSINLTGTITVEGGEPGIDPGGMVGSPGGIGRIRIEHEQITLTGTLQGTSRISTLVPYTVLLSTTGPSTVRVTQVGGVAVPTSPTGSFIAPDLAINDPDPVTVDLLASNIPLGTVVTLTLLNETTGSQTVQTTPLAGTLENSTATTSATFSAGVTQVLTEATWTP